MDRGPLTYRRLAEFVPAAAAWLRAAGLGPHDAAALVVPNGPIAATAFLATATAGACAPLNPAYRAEEFAFYLDDLKARLLLVAEGMESPAREEARKRGIRIVEIGAGPETPAGVFTLDGRLPEGGTPIEPAPGNTALILHTSGTTARPKMVPLTQANLQASASHIAATLGLGAEDCCLNVMPLFHIHGLVAAVLASLRAGASVVCTPGFLAPSFFGWLQRTSPTWYTAVPTMHQAILSRAGEDANREILRSHRLGFARSSSAALPRPVLEQLEQTLGVPVVEAYGMTEAAHQMASNPLPPGSRKPGSVGRAAGPEIAILDSAGRPLDPGRPGEVCIRGPNVTSGYLNNPEANARAFTNGWLRTGDEGVLDRDGYLSLTGRLKEQINRAGEKISPLEVDGVLMDHPAVASALSFSVPHPVLGEDIAAAVILRPHAAVTERELREYVATRLAYFKTPRTIVFVDAIPTGPTGKLQRLGLAERLGVTADVPVDDLDLTPPSTPVEEIVAAAWAEVMGRPAPGVRRNFFALGGDSILATRLVARLRQQLAVEVPLLALFDAPSIEGISQVVEGLLAEDTGQEMRTLPAWFEAQAEFTPDAVAVTCEGQRLTYRELNLRANRVAHRLLAMGVVPETLVGLYAEPSLDLVVGVLAILKAGGAYLPIDRGYPAERRAFMLKDAGAQLLLTQRELAGSLGGSGLRMLCIEDVAATEDPGNPATGLGPDNLAYVIYTSGSTGTPKGVLVTHRNVGRLFRSVSDCCEFGADDVWTLFHSIAFDFSVWECWGALLHGGRLVVVPYLTSRSPELFHALLAREQVTVLNQTPSAFGQLIEADARSAAPLALRLVILGGEALNPRMLEPWFARHGDQSPRVVNMYGITETTVHVTWRPMTKADLGGGSVIGRPLADLTVHVLDPEGQPAAVGVPGEIFVGGAGLARGYLNRPGLTAQRFVTRELPGHGAVALYRSGDRGRLLPGGDLEFLGRLDGQVKLRGFRIEPAEIEAELARHPAVAGSAVVVQEAGDDTRLIAFFVARDGVPDASELRVHLRRTLPEAMVPSAFEPLQRLPLTPSGKIDRAMLSHLPVRPAPADGTAPATPTEATVAAVWEEVLGVPRVGREDRFIDLGGHSLLAVRVASRLRERYGVDVSIRTMLEHAALVPLANEIDRLVAVRSGTGIPVDAALPGRADQVRAPATAEQRVLWEIERSTPGTATYHVRMRRRIEGPLDLDTLAAAFEDLATRHEAFRTSLDEEAGGLVLCIAPSVRLPIEVLDFRERPLPDAEHGAGLAMDERSNRPFDLRCAPLCRVTVARLAPEDTLLQLTVHHLVCDGWSMRLIFEALAKAYAERSEGRPPAPEPVRTDFGDYAAWLATPESRARNDAHLEYWRTSFDGADLGVDIPADHPRPARLTFEGHSERLVLAQEQVVRLEQAARAQGTTLNVMLMAGFRILLHRLNGQEDLTFGTVLAGRDVTETENMIGYFARTVLLRTRVTDHTTLPELLRETRTRIIGALDHPASLDAVMNVVRTPPDWSFRVLFSFNEDDCAPSAFGAARIRPVPAGQSGAKVDLGVAAARSTDGLEVVLTTREFLFDPDTARRFLGCYEALLNAIAAGTAGPVAGFPLFQEGERDRILGLAPGAELATRVTRTIGELFLEQARRGPERIALVGEHGDWTFGMLAGRAERLAAELRRQRIGPGDIVAIISTRSAEMVVAMVGVTLAGAAYMPIDSDLPAERIRGMLEDAMPRLVLADVSGAALAGAHAPVQRLDLDLAPLPEPANGPRPAGPEDPAYVMFTSGSTGRPKGVVIPHRALVNHMDWALQAFPIGPDDVVLHRTPMGFDASVWEIWGPLLSGGRLVLARRDRDADPLYIRNSLRAHGVTMIQLVPSMLSLLLELDGLEGCDTLRRVFCGGEPLSSDLVRRFHAAHGAELVNLYGPTEVTIDATSWRSSRGFEAGAIPIGRPIANVLAYILDARQEPVPVGFPGELYLGGLGVGLGYLNRPDLTALRFIPDPFDPPVQGRMYRTGDRARFRADGNIEYLGRADEQLKLHGIRFEPGEIESRLNAFPEVLESAVGVVPHQRGGARLVAWVVCRPGTTMAAEALRRDLARVLPRSLVPSAVVFLDRLPRTSSGKIDRRALPDPAAEPAPYEPPGTPMETRVAEAWAEVFGRERIGRQDDLFALGGHSLVAMRIAGRLRSLLGVDVSLRTILEFPTVGSLAAELEQVVAAAEAAGEDEMPRLSRTARVLRPVAATTRPPAP